MEDLTNLINGSDELNEAMQLYGAMAEHPEVEKLLKRKFLNEAAVQLAAAIYPTRYRTMQMNEDEIARDAYLMANALWEESKNNK